MSRALLKRAILFLAASACVDQCRAAPPPTWNGLGFTDRWTDSLNWAAEVVPANDGSADISFAASRRLTPNVDTPWSINSLSFDSTAPEFTIGGSKLTIGAGGISNNSPDLQTINTGIDLGASHDWNATSGSLDLGGRINNGGHLIRSFASAPTIVRNTITGAGGLEKYGLATLTLGNGATDTAPNSYSGPTTIYAGAVTLDKAAGTVAIAADLISNGGTITANRSGQFSPSTNVLLTGGVVNFGESNTIGSFTPMYGGYNTFADMLHLTSSAPYALTMASGISLAHFNFTSTSGGGMNLPTGGASSTTLASINLGSANRAINVADGSAAQDLLISGVVSGSGGIIKTGPGTLALNNTANTYSGTTNVQAGILEIADDSSLGSNATVNVTGKLRYMAQTSTSRSFNLTGGGTLEPRGGTLTLNNATVSGGFLTAHSNFGSFEIGGGTVLTGTTISDRSTIVYQIGPATLNNFTNYGYFRVEKFQNLSWNTGTNGGNADLVIDGTANVSHLVSNGTIYVSNLLSNSGAPLVMQTVGGAFSSDLVVADTGSINLGGQNLELHSARLFNYGSVSGGPINIHAGSLAIGRGSYGPVNLFDGGTFSPGNSPGTANTGASTWNAGGTYLFEMINAAGIAGTGWDLWNISGDLSITAGTSPASRFSLSVVSMGSFGTFDNTPNFNKDQNHSWRIATATAGITGFAPDKFNIDSSQFINPRGGGTFSIARTGNDIFLNFDHGPQWNAQSGSWASPGSWLPVAVPNGPAAGANLLGVITAPRQITLDGDKTVKELHFDNPNKYTIAAPGTLTIGDGTSGLIGLTAGSHEISAPLAIDGNLTVAGAGDLTLSGNVSMAPGKTLTKDSLGTLNITAPPASGALAIRAGTLNLSHSTATVDLTLAVTARFYEVDTKVTLGFSPNAQVLESNHSFKSLSVDSFYEYTQTLDLASSPAPGAFTSISVYSADLDAAKIALYYAVASANSPDASNPVDGIIDSGQNQVIRLEIIHPNTRVGIARLGDHIYIRSTRIGDLNLDGQVTISDFIDLASHFGQAGTWQEGDLNYDGLVTISDFIDLASNFGASYSGGIVPISSHDQAMLDSFAASIGADAVPEPGAFISLLLATTFITRRRGRMR